MKFQSTELAKKLFPYEAYNSWKKIIEANPEKCTLLSYQGLGGGISISHDDYLKAWNELKILRKSFLLKMDQYDAVISPTCPITPPSVQKLLENDDFFTKIKFTFTEKYKGCKSFRFSICYFTY